MSPAAHIATAFALLLSGVVGCGNIKDDPISAGATRVFHGSATAVEKAAVATIPEMDLSLKSREQSGDTVILTAQETGFLRGDFFARLMIEPSKDGTSLRIDWHEMIPGLLPGGPPQSIREEEFFTHVGRKLGEYP